MKLITERPYADPEAAARQLVQLAASVEPVQDGRIHIEKLNASFLYALKANGPEFGAAIKYAIEQGSKCTKAAPMCGCWRQALTSCGVSKATSPTSTQPATRKDQFQDKAMQGASGFLLRDANMRRRLAWTPVAGNESTVENYARAFRGQIDKDGWRH